MSKKPRPMVTLRSPDGKRTETLDISTLPSHSKKDLREAGYDGWTKIKDHDDEPPHVLTDEKLEAARLNVMTRAEFLAEILRRVEERITELGLG